MVLVAEDRYRDLNLALVTFARRGRARFLPRLMGQRPAAVDLGVARRFPLGRDAAAFDRPFLGLGQPRPARFDHCVVDNLRA